MSIVFRTDNYQFTTIYLLFIVNYHFIVAWRLPSAQLRTKVAGLTDYWKLSLKTEILSFCLSNLFTKKIVQCKINPVTTFIGKIRTGRQAESVFEKGFTYGAAIIRVFCKNGLQVHGLP